MRLGLRVSPLVVACALLSACSITTTTVTENTVKEGDFTVSSNEALKLKNGASLTVKGNLSLDGTIDCEAGAIAVTVEKHLTVKKGITCLGRTGEDGAPKDGITIVVKGGMSIDPSASITSDGHIQIVDDAGKVLSADALKAAYEDVESDTGKGGPRIGPLKPEADGSVSLLTEPQSHAGDWLLSAMSEEVVAQDVSRCTDQYGGTVDDCIRIGGTWVVGHNQEPEEDVNIKTPERGVKKIILLMNFGPGKEVRLQDFSLKGPDGRDGKDGPKGCDVKGEKGEDAFRLKVNAGKIRIRNFSLALGAGGKGGDAVTNPDCYPVGKAKGGDGGKAGNFKMEADESFEITGRFTIHPGPGGDGGAATAFGGHGNDGCPGQKGGDAIAIGGKGGENKKELSITGTVTGTENIEISTVYGGDGGEATANPGDGGNGTGCGCGGGEGGKGTATAGIGGNASIDATGVSAEPAVGGAGGDASAEGGNGGKGGTCDPFGPGGNGGKGGDADATEGVGGTATTNGPDGTVVLEQGGNGGNGGDGCNEGLGGGPGIPKGKAGVKGKNLCPPKGASSSRPYTDPRMSSSASSRYTETNASSASASSAAREQVSSSKSIKPKVTMTSPVNGETDVPLDAHIMIGFSKPMREASLHAAARASFRFEPGDMSDTSMELIPFGLEPGKKYNFSISTLATDTEGNPLEETVTVTFTTAKGDTHTPPPPPPPPPPPSTTPPQEYVPMLIISGKKVPSSQAIIEAHADCPAHYHAGNGSHVTATDGSQLPDPGGCYGYGAQQNIPTKMCTPDGATCQ